MAEVKKRSGGCLCGQVRYEINGSIRDSVACYCKMCQRDTGNFLVANQLEEENLTLLSDESLAWYASSENAKRGFCKHCGSPLFFKAKGS